MNDDAKNLRVITMNNYKFYFMKFNFFKVEITI